MKTILWLISLVALVLDLTYAEPEPVVPEARKTRHPSSSPTVYNSISGPDSETLSKLQNQVAPSGQIPLKQIGQPLRTSEASPAYVGTLNQPLSSHVPTSTHQNIAGQYYMAMTPHGTGNQLLAPATTPLIMQYINPQGQPTGGLQYIQLLRPILYPYNTQYAQPSYVQQQQQPAAINQHQHQHLHHPHTLSHYSAHPSPTSPPNSQPTTQSSFVPFQPSSLAQYAAATTASHHLQSPLAYNQPVGQYSSPMISYYPPRISLINPPGDMNLNTNEYMPPPGDHVFIKGVKSIRA
ncbi:putative uncharacterized protein DDB_G0291608 [Topomyia yanbarensis]|uniref:putative uncharacterized protein DDB_G0291608 n=1 Tax=Topomyia yanbarensis TaxID=2498891 RepID=UPI00273AA203|nr:putative uncharacterized protein DDB_G0291608 [Topomyia yanbarensis]